MKQICAMFLCVIGLAALAQTNLAPKVTEWQTVPGKQWIEQGAGIDGEPALVYERSDKADYMFTRVKVPGMKPGKRYLVGAYVKTVGMPRTRGGATVAIEYSNVKGEFSGGVWPEGITNAPDWTKVEDYVTVKADAKTPTMLLYMRKGATGKAFFSRPYVYEAKLIFHADIIAPRCKYAMAPGKTDFMFSIFTEGLDHNGKSFTLNVFKDKKLYATRTSPCEANGARLIFKGLDLTPGDYSYTLKFDAEEMEEESGFFRVLPEGAKPAKGNHVTVDDAGRVILNGKPFMPIGMYANGNDSIKDFQFWKNAGFNCMMDYDVIHWKRCEKAPADPNERAAQVLKALDDLDAQGIKILFSLKDIHPGGWTTYGSLKGHVEMVDLLVKATKGHPTVLGWYVNDEKNDKAFYRDLRYRVSMIDPFHPTFNVIGENSIGYSDVYMLDPYPFHKAEDGCARCRKSMNNAAKLFGNAVVTVPQTFGWYLYSKEATTDTFFPTMQQMRGQTLLEAAMGSKGFILYSYFDCKRHKEKSGIDRWPDILELTRMLHSLEPLIMSLETAPKAVVTNREGEVVATAFAANGKVAVLVASLEGKTTAEIVVPGQPNLKSRYGLTKNLGGGRYLFEANGCDGDVLE